MPDAIPRGFSTITAHLCVDDAKNAIEFYRKAFNAEELGRMPDEKTGRIMHATMKIGDSMLMIADEYPEYGSRGARTIGGTPVSMHLYVENADATFNQAVRAGAEVAMPMMDAFWGDRYGKLKDPFGHEWSIATHKEDVRPEEMGDRARKAFDGFEE